MWKQLALCIWFLHLAAIRTVKSTPPLSSAWDQPPPPRNGSRIKGPEKHVPNCAGCPLLTVPEFCEYLPKPAPASPPSLAASKNAAPPASLVLQNILKVDDPFEEKKVSASAPRPPPRSPARPAPRRPSRPQKGRPQSRGRGRRGRQGRSLLALATTQASPQWHVALGRGLLAAPLRRHPRGYVPPFRLPPQSMVDGIRANISSWFRGPGPHCGFWTRECVRQYLEQGNKMGMPRGPEVFFSRNDPATGRLVPGKLPEGYLDLFPDLAPGDFGSCAVVAVGINLLHARRGREIDAHDTVIRYNSPIGGYEGDVGARVDVFYWKLRSEEKEYGREKIRPSRFYTWKGFEKYLQFSRKEEQPTLTFRGMPTLWPSSYPNKMMMDAYSAYAAATGDLAAPMGGLKLALNVLSSGLCSRVDFYGFTARGGGKYFNRGAMLKALHAPGLAHMMLAQAMAAGRACIYD
eukprot:jgi/Mesvir1/24587/Mv21909-RA.1